MYVSRCLKEELVLATDKRPWSVSKIMSFKTVVLATKELKNKAFYVSFKNCMHSYVVLSNSYHFQQDSEIALFKVRMFVVITLFILYHYTIYA